jgi:hypothetical protein
MFVVTADQRDSRHAPDVIHDTLGALKRLGGRRLRRTPVRTIGDELQALTHDADCALEMILWLDRVGHWSVGCGIGRVNLPLPRDLRSAGGPAFFAAREAVTAAKKRSPHFAIGVDEASALTAADVQPLIELLLVLRGRRTEEGWELQDLLKSGVSQTSAAEQLAITAQAVSQRARTAALRLEAEARPALARLLAAADVESEKLGA